ncbi:sensor histidine kinase [Actinomadura rudentiformis]|uniref:histidine kinase n=1 Tax=Actinomadura rudentiformis TaxID=359158 RepID=A0A6H9YTR7_9ACTN|nr:sensor domain-containing protein [Actinomadura rudentiformis]KAB2350261.1 sensor histidine kinase [Actinomadura rudentiformis]
MSIKGPRTALEAVGQRRFLLGAWPWRSVAYLVSGACVAFAAATPLVLAGWQLGVAVAQGPLTRSVFLVAVGVAVVALAGPPVAIPLAELERWRLRLVDARPVRSGHRALGEADAPRRLRTRYTESATWREFAYACVLVTVMPVVAVVLGLVLLWIAASLVSPLLVQGSGPVALGPTSVGSVGEALPYALVSLALLPALPYLAAVLAGGQAALARVLLQGPSGERLRAELVEVSRSRARLVDAFEAERRRIERDLHDGAQQRLISLTLQIGMARLDVAPGSPAAESLATAHAQAKGLMDELRELIRGIHPRVLTDRGLAAALGELGDQAALPVTVDADLPGRFPAQAEATAYFAAVEALNNAAKHSGARRVRVAARHRGGLLTVEVEDDGRGGAEVRDGGGLTGLADRAAVIDGRMFLSSPRGGPTLLRLEIPCSTTDPSA